MDIKKPKGTANIRAGSTQSPQNPDTETDNAKRESRADLMFNNTGNIGEDRGHKRSRNRSRNKSAHHDYLSKMDAVELEAEPCSPEPEPPDPLRPHIQLKDREDPEVSIQVWGWSRLPLGH